MIPCNRGLSVAPQGLLVPRGVKGGLAAGFLAEHKIYFPWGILVHLFECLDSWGTMLDLRWEDRLGPIDEE